MLRQWLEKVEDVYNEVNLVLDDESLWYDEEEHVKDFVSERYIDSRIKCFFQVLSM